LNLENKIRLDGEGNVMIQTEAKDSINMTKVSTKEGAKEIEMAEAVTTIEDKDEAMHMDMDVD
jgi:hypothetical protein